MAAIDTKYQEFNLFQTKFFTSIQGFNNYSNNDFKKHGYTLLNNLAKGFPNLADLVINLNGINWRGSESPAILQALQRNFVTSYKKPEVPFFIYFKGNVEKEKTSKAKKTEKGYVFDSEIKAQICSILFVDSKTFEDIKYSDEVQFLGKQILGEFQQTETVKKTRKKKEIKL